MSRNRLAATVIAASAIAGTFWLSAGAAPAWRVSDGAGEGTGPVVVELFTSEGCSSCPPADTFLSDLTAAGADGVTLIALSEHVDYWNRLGWVDPFSSAAFTARQREYAESLSSDVYTPQMVVDGRWQFVGSDRRAAATAVRDRASVAKLAVTVGAQVSEGKARVHMQILPAGPAVIPDADVLVALTEDGLTSSVTAGENAGRRLPHVAVTRTLMKVGRTKRGASSGAFDASPPLDPHWALARMHVVALVQARADGTIVGAASAPIESDGQPGVERR